MSCGAADGARRFHSDRPIAFRDVDRSALSDLRRTRRRRRLGDTEWFDVAYHVYLAAFLGGGAAIVLSGYVGDTPLSDDGVNRVLTHGPAVLGVLVAITVAIGLRSGAEGGPLSIESADARHVLLAPVPRRLVLRRPLLQRVRAVAGGAAIVGALAGLLAAQRMPGTPPSWVMSGAAFGACVGVVYVTIAVHAHAFRLTGWIATALGGALFGWQLWAALADHRGPFDSVGDLAMWGYRQDSVDLIAVGAIVVVAVFAVLVVGRLRIEHLDRRGDLVSQLRFAVTTQDLRTVVLLRRQLRQEQARRRPLFAFPQVGSGEGAATIRRSAQSLLRMPVARLGRISALGAAAGVAAGMAARGTTPAVLACGVLLFVMGLDLIEPLSQEIDHPGRADDLPVDAGWLHLHLLVPPLALAVVPALGWALAFTVVDPDLAVGAFVLAVPITWAGMTGSVVNALRDDAAGPASESVMMPPEMTGMKNVIVMLLPLIVSTLGCVTILALRVDASIGSEVQLVAALGAFLGAFGWWVRKRTDLATSWSVMKQEAMP
jgi:hypothetical protein